ncbi:4683_t:CDS:2, partial [Scutellospora calospora]
ENKEFSRFLEGENDAYIDPDYEYAILDDSYSEISCNSNTTNTIKASNVDNHEDFTFINAMSNFIKAYADSRSINDNNLEEININWLDSETDFTSEAGSLVDFDNEQELDIEITNHEETSENSNQCITDIKQDEDEPPKQVSLMIEKHPEQFGKALGRLIWKSKRNVKENIHYLENPLSLQEYKHGFPLTIRQFFNSMLDYIQYQKWITVHKKQQQRRIIVTEYDSTRGEKISLFLISVLLTITFPSVNIWLTHILSSLCQKPHYQSSLYTVLCTANVVSHTSRHERRLTKMRQKDVDPCHKLWRGENILNICIMDNVDLKEKTFTYDNIFDATRKTMHCIIRIIIQFKFPKPLSEIVSENIVDIDIDTNFRVGTSIYLENELSRCTNMFNTLINENSDFDIQDIMFFQKSNEQQQVNGESFDVIDDCLTDMF